MTQRFHPTSNQNFTLLGNKIKTTEISISIHAQSLVVKRKSYMRCFKCNFIVRQKHLTESFLVLVGIQTLVPQSECDKCFIGQPTKHYTKKIWRNGQYTLKKKNKNTKRSLLNVFTSKANMQYHKIFSVYSIHRNKEWQKSNIHCMRKAHCLICQHLP